MSQNDASGLNQITVDQSGTSQQAFVNQSGVAFGLGVGSLGNVAVVTLSGTSNLANVYQSDAAQGGEVTVTQSGQQNVANVYQAGNVADNTATVEQSGTTGAATIQQIYGSEQATAIIKQSGTTNNGQIYQFQGVGNSVTIDQLTTGTNNYVEVYQGDDNFAPDGSDFNTTTVTQRGTLNAVRFDLIGDNNTATMSQTGGGNLIRGVAGTSPYANYAGQYGNGNTLTITQVSDAAGPGQTANVYQGGNNNTTTITQTTSINN